MLAKNDKTEKHDKADKEQLDDSPNKLNQFTNYNIEHETNVLDEKSRNTHTTQRLKPQTLNNIDLSEFEIIEDNQEKVTEKKVKSKSIEKSKSKNKEKKPKEYIKSSPKKRDPISPRQIEKKKITESRKENISTNEKVSKAKTLDKKSSSKLVNLNISTQNLPIRFPADVRSDSFRKGNQVILRTDQEIRAEGHLIVAQGAKVRAIVKQNKTKKNGKTIFSLKFQAVQAVNGQWLFLDYPEYSAISKQTVVFPVNTLVQKVKLKNQSINIRI